MRLNINGGTMLLTHKAKIAGYHKKIWFSKRAITNITALSNIIHQYKITYDSDDKMLIVHREAEENKYGVQNAQDRAALILPAQ